MLLFNRIRETTVYLPTFTIKLKQVNILINMLNIPVHGMKTTLAPATYHLQYLFNFTLKLNAELPQNPIVMDDEER